MRKVALLITVILSLSVVGCRAKKDLIKFDYEYQGENKSWESKYNIVGVGEFYKQDDGTLKYKGEIDRILEVTYKNDISELSSIL